MAKSYKQAIHEAIDFTIAEFPNAKLTVAIEAAKAIVSELERNKRAHKVTYIRDRIRYRIA